MSLKLFVPANFALVYFWQIPFCQLHGKMSDQRLQKLLIQICQDFADELNHKTPRSSLGSLYLTNEWKRVSLSFVDDIDHWQFIRLIRAWSNNVSCGSAFRVKSRSPAYLSRILEVQITISFFLRTGSYGSWNRSSRLVRSLLTDTAFASKRI